MDSCRFNKRNLIIAGHPVLCLCFSFFGRETGFGAVRIICADYTGFVDISGTGVVKYTYG